MTVRAFGAPHLYIQGAGALERLPELAASLGKRPFVVADPFVAERYGERVGALLGAAAQVVPFNGECTAAEIDRLAALARQGGFDIVIGMGGGKAIDTAKGVRIATGIPIIIVPTIASNDSPTSRLSVIYDENHRLCEVRRMATNPDAVLVDSSLIVEAPVRFFLAGIGDALSKRYESDQCIRSNAQNFFGGTQTELLRAISTHCDAVLRRDAMIAVTDVSQNRISPQVEAVIEASVLLSGLAFENGGLSIAHSLTRGFSAIPAVNHYLHGEQVALATLVQLALDQQNRHELHELSAFLEALGLPRRLSDLGGTHEDAVNIASITMRDAPYIHNYAGTVTEEKLIAAFDLLEQAFDQTLGL